MSHVPEPQGLKYLTRTSASIPFPSCEWIGCFSNFEMICFVSSVIENKISDCPERPDSKSRIAAVSDKDKALP